MPNVIDALVVTLGLDASAFTQGQKQAAASMKATTEEANTTAKLLQASGKTGAEFFTQLRNEALGLFAVMAGARSITDFVKDVTTSDAALGRVSKTLDMSAQDLAAWEGAAKRVGGTAAGMQSAFQGIMEQFQRFQITGEQQPIMAFFHGLGVNVADATGKLRPLGDILKDVTSHIAGMDPARATSMIRGAGLGDPGVINLLLSGLPKINQLLEEQRRLGLPSDDDIAREQKILNDFLNIEQEITTIGRKILAEVLPYVDQMLTQFDALIQKNMPGILKAIASGAEAVGKFLDSIHWDQIGKDIEAFAGGANDAAKSVGGWQKATELLFGLWLGSRFTAVLGRVGALAAFSPALTALLGVLLQHGDTDPNATPDGFIPGWKPDNGAPQPSGAPLDQPNAPRVESFGHLASRLWHGIVGGSAETRGMRNNNPLNLEYRPGQQGIDPNAPSDGRFGHYVSMEAGVASATRQMLAYQDRDHLNTVAQITTSGRLRAITTTQPATLSRLRR